ncbi:GNAT family N-acetyltransferase [Mucilaginibacter aquatilis]|uniref:GNAT family N-acetyltransferase n=1 Tax=Mucilaginibacter aquatilis TaxID=1517760 RepID=A0A6I4I945_9SPHI|nr:GNAT family N-acetyltransferase [Mucilaginibacter aquatilis]MVN89989.1 GNAT family N-acetyltransferase [Mucilaginibacter aquatilis]
MYNTQSKRLKLIPLAHHQLLLSINDWSKFEQSLDLNPSTPLIDEAFKIEMSEAMNKYWLPNTLAYPELYHWYTNWQIVLKSTNSIIGTIGFGGYPDDYGSTSIGYMIFKDKQGNGFATEALSAMLDWGFGFSILKKVKADTQTSNKASQRVLLKTGFKYTHIEGSTLYYEVTKDRFTQSNVNLTH